MNFKINKKTLLHDVIVEVLEKTSDYGRLDFGQKKRVVMEYSSPNIAKPFHAGHLRTTVLGNFLTNLYRFCGFHVTSINYLGDWGKQYGLLAVGFLKYGSEEELVRDPIKHLFDVYVKINADAEKDPSLHQAARDYFCRMEAGDDVALALWRRFRELSIEKYKKLYERLNVHFEVYSGESLYSSQKVAETLAEFETKGLIKEDKGAKIIDLKEYGLNVAIVWKSDGSSLYLTRDIACAIDRKRTYDFDESFYVIASQQTDYMKQLFKILELNGFEWAKNCHHISYGMVMGMSTRKGTVVFLEDILNEAQSEVLKVMKQNEDKFAHIENPEEVADLVGLSAIIVQDFSARRIKDYTFDWKRVTSFEGDTGAYLQFAHARLCSIERKVAHPVNPKANLDLIPEPAAIALAEKIARFPETILDAYNSTEPCTIVTYLMSLCHAISTALDVLWVVGAPRDEADARLLLFWSARVTLGNGLRLLGLKPLERM